MSDKTLATANFEERNGEQFYTISSNGETSKEFGPFASIEAAEADFVWTIREAASEMVHSALGLSNATSGLRK